MWAESVSTLVTDDDEDKDGGDGGTVLRVWSPWRREYIKCPPGTGGSKLRSNLHARASYSRVLALCRRRAYPADDIDVQLLESESVSSAWFVVESSSLSSSWLWREGIESSSLLSPSSRLISGGIDLSSLPSLFMWHHRVVEGSEHIAVKRVIGLENVWSDNQ